MQTHLREHQLDALDKLESGSILAGGVGSGKSRVSIAYFFIKVCKGGIKINGEGETLKMLAPRPLYIITTAKKRDALDWEKELTEFGLAKDASNSFSGYGAEVESWNNIKKFEGVKDAFFIFDEQRLIGSGAWVKSFLKIAKANQWILLSATPGDNWLDYIPVFLANGFYKNRSEFIAKHVVYSRYAKFPKVDHYVDTTRLEQYRRELLVDMPFGRLTSRHHFTKVVGYDQEAFDLVRKKRWDPYKDMPIQEAGGYFHLMRRVVNENEERLAAVAELAVVRKKIVVFYNFDYELRMLRELSDILDCQVSEWNGHKHEPIPMGERWVYLVQYQAGAEGWNCTTTDTIVFFSLTYSYRLRQQAEGRIDRLDTPFVDLYYYTIQTMSPIDVAILKAYKHKKSFNERMFKVGKK